MLKNSSFYSVTELELLGFRSIGENVLISRKASFYGVENILIGDHVRIDDFCILSGNIKIGSYIHISAYSALYGGKAGIEINDFCGISARSTIYAMTDDFSGSYMVGVMIDSKLRKVIEAAVVLEKYVQIGAHCLVLPGVKLCEGVAVGGMSLINKNLDSWGIYAGVPCRFIKERKKDLLNLTGKFV